MKLSPYQTFACTGYDLEKITQEVQLEMVVDPWASMIDLGNQLGDRAYALFSNLKFNPKPFAHPIDIVRDKNRGDLKSDIVVVDTRPFTKVSKLHMFDVTKHAENDLARRRAVLHAIWRDSDRYLIQNACSPLMQIFAAWISESIAKHLNVDTFTQLKIANIAAWWFWCQSNTEEDLNEHIVRGQYTASGNKKGYREEKGVDSESRTETYIAMKLGISNWRWSGVPFYIRTGKQMPTKVTEIVVHFRETPHQMFRCSGGNCPRANKLILRLQPNEGIVLKIGMKVPGAGFEVRQVTMDFSYAQLGGVPSGDAYARLIDDCIQGDPTLFTRSDAVEASWKFFDPVLRYWKDNPDAPLYGYPAGTWGPLESEAMMHEHGADWTNPCKNLTNTDQYCEL